MSHYEYWYKDYQDELQNICAINKTIEKCRTFCYLRSFALKWTVFLPRSERRIVKKLLSFSLGL